MHKRNLAARAGLWSASHRKKAILGWLLFVVLAVVLGGSVGQQKLADEDMGNGGSKVADQAIADAGFPDEAAEQVLIQGKGSISIRDPRFAAAVEDVERRLSAVAHVRNVKSPLDAGNMGQLSRDGRSALLSFDIADDDDDIAQDRVDATLAATAAAQRAHPDLRIEQFGDASAGKALQESFDEDFKRAEYLSLPITLIILVIAFGALVAAGIPLLLGLTAVLATIGLLGPVSQLVALDDAVASVVLLVGLAVGVDYSMFYLRRYMEERDSGRGGGAALEAAASTSGHAVMVSGITVIIAMAGMFFAGSSIFASFGVGTILVVAVAVIGSLTVLPAVLSKLCSNGWIEKGRVPFIAARRHRNQGESRVWGAILDRVLRRPVLSAALSGGALVALAIPALGLHTINTGIQGIPRDLPVMQTYDRIQAAFPGGPQPAVVVVQADDVTAPAIRQAVAEFRREAVATGELAEPMMVEVNPARTLATVSIAMQGSGTDDASYAALDTLRNDVLPATIGAVDGVRVNVGGLTAGSKDFNDSMRSHLPIVFAFVLGMAFLLLLVTFRSIVVPLKAIVLNLLSVAAAYGVLKLVFQDGHGEDLLGFTSLGGVTSWLPLFLFVILFGLSMDYHVFILSRVREAVDRGERTEDAVTHGIKSTAGVVTSAAVVMIAVFSVFATLSALDFKMMGVGLATAVLIDATIVRAVLLPSAMKLLGERNWYLPRWLEWLPRLSVEGAAPATAVAPANGASPAQVGGMVADPGRVMPVAADRNGPVARVSPAALDSEDLSVQVHRSAERVTFVLTGDLDLVTGGAFREQLAAVERERPPLIVIDLRELRFMDSSGLAQLVRATQQARAEQRRLVLVTGSKPIDRILAVSGVTQGLVETTADPATLDE
jgi:RND superfamily putative drug exporter